ncbi:MAG: hypothetical protein AAF532_09540 [Planctomycetota bacterium]
MLRRHEIDLQVGASVVVADQELTVVEITPEGEVVFSVRAHVEAAREKAGEPMLAR